MPPIVKVRNDEGATYNVSLARARKEMVKGGELEGFKIISLADGSPFKEPAAIKRIPTPKKSTPVAKAEPAEKGDRDG